MTNDVDRTTCLESGCISRPSYLNLVVLSQMSYVTFLLGAGASIPAGYSCTEQLTKKILASEGYFRYTDGRYLPGTASPNTDYRTPAVRRIVDWLFKRTKEYFQEREDPKESNYEDIYYLASQLRDDRFELHNPAVLPLIQKLKCEMISWPEFEKYPEVSQRRDIDPERFSEVPARARDINLFCEETCHYIEDIVSDVLSHSGKCCTKHLEIIKAIHRTPGLKLKGIATLAHDTHVERKLGRADIKLADGFSPPIPGDSLRIWKNQFSSSDGIPFMKLHGSVNWTRFDLSDQSKYKELPSSEIGIREPSNLDDSVYQYDEVAAPRPFLLIGTFNKPVQYNWGLMLDIHYRFRKILRDTDTLVVCGYSFGDKAINTQLIFWCAAERSRSLVVIDPRGKQEVIGSARFAAGRLLANEDSAQFITKPMEDVEPDELLRLLVSSKLAVHVGM
ncbi:MAG: hypothetical protein OXH01_09105 [Bacteroidetes bacterium]|nr:hypothetical protein [Bacteroidota bacterium]